MRVHSFACADAGKLVKFRNGRANVGEVRVGQRVGKYVLGDRIARGGMAEVWAARVEGPGGFVKPLALKFISESFAGDPDLERLFVNEARVAAKLQHANLVTVFDFDRWGAGEGDSAGRYYIAMERVDGHDLRRVLQMARQKRRPVPVSVALYIAGEVLKGLRHVHEHRDETGERVLGLVHRDVSPHNVLVGMGGEVKLSDFGIAKAMCQTQSLSTQPGTVRGKLAYASPQQLRSEPLDHRADQFALGIILWEMLAGRRLFAGADQMDVVAQVLRCDIPPLPVAASVEPTVETVVRRMLAASPANRFSSTASALSAVTGAPGYALEVAGLVELMHVLFGTTPLALPPTMPVRLADVRPPDGLADTRQLARTPGGELLAFRPSEKREQSRRGSQESGSQTATKAGREREADLGAEATSVASEARSRERGREPRLEAAATTLRGYVAGAARLRLGWSRPAPHVGPSRRMFWAVALVLPVGVGAITWSAHRHHPAASPALSVFSQASGQSAGQAPPPTTPGPVAVVVPGVAPRPRSESETTFEAEVVELTGSRVGPVPQYGPGDAGRMNADSPESRASHGASLRGEGALAAGQTEVAEPDDDGLLAPRLDVSQASAGKQSPHRGRVRPGTSSISRRDIPASSAAPAEDIDLKVAPPRRTTASNGAPILE